MVSVLVVHIHGFYGGKVRIRPTGSKGLCFIGLWYIINRVQYNTVQYSTVQYSTVQYSTSNPTTTMETTI